jgi:hypothetical protein
MIDLEKIRKESLQKIESYNLKVNHTLPLLDDSWLKRTLSETISRVLCLNSILILSNNMMPRESIIEWIENNNLKNALSEIEKDYIFFNKKDEDFRKNVESIYMFSWILKLVNKIQVTDQIPNDLITKITVNTGESIFEFQKRCSLRAYEEILQEADFLYCLDWSNKNYYFETRKEKFHLYVIHYRRKAIEWIITDESWDKINLDT